MAQMPTPLSSEDLASIEATHRGFLYQHLYLVGCMLIGFPARLQAAVSEHDEDIELDFEDEYIYIQVKTRQTPPLQPSHLTTTKARFIALADEHKRGSRTRTPRFFLVTNAAPSAKLQSEILTAEWPPGTQILHPGGVNDVSGRMPPAWPNLQDAFNWCVDRASEMPSITLDATTLILKLAGFSWLLSSGQFGTPPHCLNAESFTTLLEQVKQSFHSLPASPRHYIAQKSEPHSQSTSKVRVVAGISGSGKTGWVSSAAAQSLGFVTYIDASAMFARTLREEVVREACACLPIARDQARLAMLAAKTGVAGLRVIERQVVASHAGYTIFVDNAHAAEDRDILELTQAVPSITWVFLCQPSAHLEVLASNLGVRTEFLRGWDQAGIARYCKSVDFQITPVDAASIESLTGGVPLFVMNLVDLARGGRLLAELLSEIRGCISETLTLQEILVSRVLDAMTPDESLAVVLIEMAKIELSHRGWTELLGNAKFMSPSRAMTALRDLRGKGVVSFDQDKSVSLHDAFAPSVSDRAERAEPEVRKRFSLELHSALVREGARWTHDVKERRRLVRRVTLMPEAGLHDEYCTAIPDLAEMVLDQEEQRLLIQALQETLVDPHLPAESRFWTLQALAFLHMSVGTSAQARAYLLNMKELMPLVEVDDPRDVLRRQAVCERGLGHWPLYEMVHAAKLYEIARYVPGEIAVGFEIVEVALADLGQPDFALKHCELILAKARDAGWFEEIPDIQRMRIRALIFLGKRDLASVALEELEPYAVEGGDLRAFIREARERLARATLSYPLAQPHPPTRYGKIVLSSMLGIEHGRRGPKYRR